MEPIKNIVQKVITDLSKGETGSATEIQRWWQTACDKKTLAHTQVVQFIKGELWVNVDSPAWHYQLNFDKKRILEELQEHIPDIKNIRFKIGKVK